MARRSNSNQSARLILFLAFAGAAAYRYGCSAQDQAPPTSTPRQTQQETQPTSDTTATQNRTASSNEGHLLLGNPSAAGKAEDNYLLDRAEHAMSYNRTRGQANWVAWHTDASDLGDTKRGRFRPDPGLPTSWRIMPNDYKDSGFDRGHICPSGDRTASRESNNATFYMSNMMPQAALLNQKVWADMEDDMRDFIRRGYETYQISGGRGEAGSIAGGKVTIPSHCWKIVVLLPKGTGDLNRIPEKSRVIAVEMRNEENQEYSGAKWRNYLTTVDAIEQSTGYDFLSNLTPEQQAKLESTKFQN